MDRKRQRIINTIVAVVVIVVCIIVILISFAIKTRVEQEMAGSTDEPPSTPGVEEPDPKPNLPGVNEIAEAKFIDLQPTLDKWRTTLNRDEKVGVMIYDLNNSRTAASYNADETFNVASIYKLLFAYDGYRQIALGAEDPNMAIVQNSERGTLDLSQCLDLMIRESYNVCADPMRNNVTRASRVKDLIRSFEMTNTTNLGLESTAADLTKLLRTIWRHSELSESLWAKLADSMLNQPPTTYDWRQGLPAGFSDAVEVYDKVGWESFDGTNHWKIYADAAILNFTELNHQYTMVVLTSNLSDYRKVTQLGRMIEETVTLQSDGVIK